MFTKQRPRASKLCILASIAAGAVLYSIPFLLDKLDAQLWGPANTMEDGGVVIQEFNWDLVPPSHRLNWKDCYPGRQCARLITPLNYSEPEGNIAIIALIRKPAGVPADSEDYRGPVLFNPGGPGGSGVDMILVEGDIYSNILGPQFDIVGFDPRGVARSTPHASFFETDAERALWGGSRFTVLNTSAALTEQWARAKIEGQLAKERDELNYLTHINTDQTARDMLQIVRAHGREKIQYWGFSYGSILGATFASMFPDKVERIVIDGVADAENYFATLWSNNLRDTDKTLQSFFDSCSNAGPEGCPFYAPTPENVSRNLTNIINSIYKTPIASTIFTSLYEPYAAFPRLAQGLADLVAGDATALYKMAEGGTAIRCNDGKRVSGSLEAITEHYEMMTKASQWGELWVSTRIGCAAWPDYPKTHFQGPFVGNTSHPMLLVGNTADPVTPLWAAKKMARGFKDSVVLTQDSPGHCSLSAPSICTQKYIRAYFQNGTLPKEGVVCPVDETIFPPVKGGRNDLQAPLSEGLSEMDRSLLQSIKSISSSYRIPAGPLALRW